MEQKWERRADQRPGEIYQAALKVFGTRGYRASKLEDVAALAGVSKGLIYRYFAGKEDLLRKSLESKVERLNVLRENLRKPDELSAEQFLLQNCQKAWDHWQSEEWGGLHKLMLGEIAQELPEVFHQWVKTAWVGLREIFAQMIVLGQQSGEFRSEIDAGESARFLLLGLSNAVVMQKHKGLESIDAWDSEVFFRTALDLFIKGIKVRANEG